MHAVGDDKNNAGAARTLLRRSGANVAAAISVLMRPARSHPLAPWPLPYQKLAVAAAIVVGVMLLLMVAIDASAIGAARRLPRWIQLFFDQITDFGKSGWLLWPLGIFFLVLSILPAATRMTQLVIATVMLRVGFLFFAVAVPGIITNIVKHIVGRARPGVGGSVDPFLFSPFSWPAAYASLPSGHATTVFSVIVAFGTLWPRARTILWIYALAIAASRVVLIAHYPSDVLAGAVVGAGGALMVRHWFALRGLGFSIGPDDILHQKPGPSLQRMKAVARTLLSQ